MRIITKIEPKNKDAQLKKRVAAYARVSAETKRLMHSLSAQISYYSSFIQSNPEWEYAGVYADKFISGTSIDKRKELLRLLSDCDKGLIDIILCKSISRFARNTVDLLKTIRHLKEIGVEVQFEKENISTFSKDGELMLSILASFAQEESNSISENVKWGLRKRFEDGSIGVANKHIYGYRYDENLKKYIIIPEEAKMIKKMFDMYINGISLKKIADEINTKGYRSINGYEFSEGTIRLLIFNEIYAGDLLRQKGYTVDPLTKKKIKNNGVLPKYLMSDCHEAIIDRETYAKVQAEMKRREGLLNPTYCFTGKIKCGICGMNYARKKAVVKGKMYVHWICRAKKEKGITCTNKNYTDEKLKSICAELLGISKFNEDVFNDRVKQIIILPNGDVQLEFIGSEKKVWHCPSKPPKVLKPKSEKPHHVFDGMIFCGVCGRRYGRVKRTNDIYWRCRSNSGACTNCGNVNYEDSEIKALLCEQFNTDSFDENIFKEKIEKIIILKGGSIEFHFKDNIIKRHEAFKLKRNKSNHTCTEEFTDKIKCGICGRTLHKFTARGKYTYWYCVNNKRDTKPHCPENSDSNLRSISTYMLGINEFDGKVFNDVLECIVVLENGDLEYHFKDGRIKVWRKT